LHQHRPKRATTIRTSARSNRGIVPIATGTAEEKGEIRQHADSTRQVAVQRHGQSVAIGDMASSWAMTPATSAATGAEADPWSRDSRIVRVAAGRKGIWAGRSR